MTTGNHGGRWHVVIVVPELVVRWWCSFVGVFVSALTAGLVVVGEFVIAVVA